MMVQQFYLAAPRAKKFVDCPCTVEEMLFRGQSRYLGYLLAVPIRPRNSARSEAILPTRVSTQVSTRASTRASKRAELQNNPGGKTSSQDTQKKRCIERKSGNSDDKADAKRGATLSKLPVELLCIIFSYLKDSSDMGDILCLGLANRYFWTIGRRYVHEYNESTLGQWADQNLVFVGKRTKPDDYPAGLFSAEEAEQLALKRTNINESDGEIHLDSLTIRYFPFGNVSRRESWSAGPKGRGDLEYICQERGVTDDPMFRLVQNEICVDETTYFPRDQEWILRNLTTKEFVSAKSISRSPNGSHGNRNDLLGFGEVVVARICWSTSRKVGIKHKANFARGVWAGHRFDITTTTRHEAETKGEKDQWRDVGKEVVDELRALRKKNEKRLLKWAG